MMDSDDLFKVIITALAGIFLPTSLAYGASQNRKFKDVWDKIDHMEQTSRREHREDIAAIHNDLNALRSQMAADHATLLTKLGELGRKS